MVIAVPQSRNCRLSSLQDRGVAAMAKDRAAAKDGTSTWIPIVFDDVGEEWLIIAQ